MFSTRWSIGTILGGPPGLARATAPKRFTVVRSDHKDLRQQLGRWSGRRTCIHNFVPGYKLVFASTIDTGKPSSSDMCRGGVKRTLPVHARAAAHSGPPAVDTYCRSTLVSTTSRVMAFATTYQV